VDVMQRLVPVLTQLECETNVLTVSHQAVLRCVLGYFLETPPEEIPYVHVPLHTIIKVSRCNIRKRKLLTVCLIKHL